MMTVNDGKGLFDIKGMFDEALRKLDLIADAKGVLRAGILWDTAQMIKAMKDGVMKELASKNDQINQLSAEIEKLNER